MSKHLETEVKIQNGSADAAEPQDAGRAPNEQDGSKAAPQTGKRNPPGESDDDTVPEPAEQVTIEARELEALKQQAQAANDNWDRVLRVTAEFENFKKRSARDRLDAIVYANEALLESVIPTLDHFEMAFTATNQADPGALDSWKKGIKMVFNQLKTILREAGLEEIDAQNQAFDPRWHEAVSQEETHERPEGHILRQVRKGYKLKDRLIRPASVVVAKAPKESAQDSEEAGDPVKTEDHASGE